MSRTVRRLPLKGSHGKWHGIVSYPTLSRPRTASWMDPGVLLSPRLGWRRGSLLRYMDHLEPDPQFGGWRVVTGFLYIETEADLIARIAREHMYWCRKNKTCRRQRKNGVRKTKRIIARELRAKLKQDLYRDQNRP